MAHKFLKGVIVGAAATAGAVAGSVFAFKKRYVEPVEEKATEINDNRRKANRKRYSAHQG